MFVEIYNASSYHRVLNLGGSVFSTSAASTKLNNQKYVSTYNHFDSLGVLHFFLLIIDIQTKSIELNLTLIEKHDYGDFSQIAVANDDDDDIIGIRESASGGLSLEVAKINRTTGLMETIGIYPAGSFSFVMVYASKRRLYYNVIDSTLYGINIDTGKLDVNIRIPMDYTIYGIDYDSTNDTLIALVYSRSTTNGWILAQIIITAKYEIQFDRIGKSEIPFEKYIWSTTYTMNTNKRLWITLWSITNENKSNFIVFNIDNGEIIENRTTHFKNLSNLVCFDRL
ncbi:unnamed protein product [Rotaria sp. Silwood1]|nr:unnamed protein product [Rotaria sp. Silwood1]CAF1363801.1 unnamed protein product [Rotaria sp. Silwood1]CAF3555962.1 unnamed protein product [Rotaria sp. Silwood1]CAF4938890.1 unnamed protein product [Rotaria sp. Silwood1]